MKKKLLTVALTATMVIGSVFSAFAADTGKKDEVLYSTTEAYTLDESAKTSKSIDNPLKGVEADEIVIEYSLTSSDTGAAWLGMAQFYNVEKNGGLAHLGYWPQICLNDFEDRYSELSTGKTTIPADSLADGKPHTFKYVITPKSMKIYVDGKEYTYSELKGNSKNITTVEESCTALFNFLTSAEKFSLGCGSATTYWGELDATSTVNSFKISTSVNAKDSANGKSPQVSPNGPGPEVPDKGVVSEKEIQNIADSAEVTGDNVPKGADLVFKPIAKDDKAFAATNEFVAKNFAEAAKGGHYAFVDISLEKAGGKVQPLNNGKVKITLTITKLNAFDELKENDVVSIYRVSDDGKEITLIGESKVAAGGKLSFETDHFSKYLFVAGAAPKDTTDNNTNTDKDADGKAPTGDTAPIMLLAFAAVVACGTVVFVNKKRAK